MKEFLVLIIALINVECQQNWQGPDEFCTTPDGKSGICYDFKKCTKLVELLKSSRNDPEVVAFLRRSVCGFDNSEPLVCCPRNTTESNPAVTRLPISETNTVNKNGGNNTTESNPTVTRLPIRETSTVNTNKNGGNNENDLFSKLPSPPICGLSNDTQSRIQGGIPALLGAWPWMAALGYTAKRDTSRIEYICGGALISDKHIITAAHCTEHPSLSLYLARLGELNLNESIQDGASPVNYIIHSAVKHPEYSASKRVNDIAILYLKDKVEFNKLIQPICLPKMERNNNFEKHFAFVVGYGRTRQKGPLSSALLQVQIPIVPNQQCKQTYLDIGQEVTPKEICAGLRSGGKDACLGDSGGPMMLPIKNVYYLIGVVSYGYLCGEPGYPGVYTRTTEYIDWIHKNVA